MTNAVDVLLVGGPAHGRVICANKSTNPLYVEAWEDGDYLGRYQRESWTNMQAERYHVAYPDGVYPTPTNSEVEAAIEAANFNPAWDLNR